MLHTINIRSFDAPKKANQHYRNTTRTSSITNFWFLPMYAWVLWYHCKAFSLLSPMSSEPLTRVSDNLSADDITHGCSGVRVFDCSCNLWACSISHLDKGTSDNNEIVLIKGTYRAESFGPQPVHKPKNNRDALHKIRHATTRERYTDRCTFLTIY